MAYIFKSIVATQCNSVEVISHIIKRPLRDACLCMGDLQAPAALHFVFLITL